MLWVTNFVNYHSLVERECCNITTILKLWYFDEVRVFNYTSSYEVALTFVFTTSAGSRLVTGCRRVVPENGVRI